MKQEQDKACGADIHKRFLTATILSRDGSKVLDEFEMTIGGIISFKSWLESNGCSKVAVESTGNYWHLVYQVLEDDIEFILANAYQTRKHAGAKTDKRDSEWLAELCLNNQIEPSRIFPREDRELRALTRARKGYVDMRTKLKARIIQELEACTIKLSSAISDVFGKSGRYILRGLIEGRNTEDIIRNIPSKRVKRNQDKIREAIQAGLSPESIFLLRSHLQMMDEVEKNIKELEIEAQKLIKSRKSDLEIVMSVPGIGFVSGVTILSEIGDYRDFNTGEQLASYCGITPSVYGSAGKIYCGHITKHGSKYLRRMAIEVAHAMTKVKSNTRLKRFYLRLLAKKGIKVAIVALARKILCLVHHLLVNRETYKDENMAKPKRIRIRYSDRSSYPTLEEMIKVITKAGYLVKKGFPEG
jgi:transposase